LPEGLFYPYIAEHALSKSARGAILTPQLLSSSAAKNVKRRIPIHQMKGRFEEQKEMLLFRLYYFIDEKRRMACHFQEPFFCSYDWSFCRKVKIAATTKD